MRLVVPALLLALAGSACGDRPGPETRLEDVTTPGESPTCIVPDGVPAGSETLGPETWVVHEGDTLALIARRCYGNEALWRDIAAANPDAVGARDTIRAGSVLRIPRDSR